MADKTPVYGLPFPTGKDTVDIERDFGSLTTKLDQGLQVNVDDPNFDPDKVAAATAPVQLYGAGRPDGRGGETVYEAPIGSVFTCTTPDTRGATGNYGAIQWVKDFFRGWVVTVGQTRQYQISKTPNWDNNGVPTSGQLRWTLSRDANGIMMYARGYQSFQAETNVPQTAFLDGTLNTWFGSVGIDQGDWGSPFYNQFWLGGTTSSTGTIIGQVRLQIPVTANSDPLSGGANWVVMRNDQTTPPSTDQRLQMYVGVQGGWPYGENVGEEYTMTMYVSELKSEIAAAAEDNPELAKQLEEQLALLRGEI